MKIGSLENPRKMENFTIHKELSIKHENKADLYLVWILQTWLILLKVGMQKYGVGHNRQWTYNLRLGGNGEFWATG
jgi:hypothetical protein